MRGLLTVTIGLLVGGAIFAGCFAFGEMRWHQEVRAAAHNNVWVHRTGTVVQTRPQVNTPRAEGQSPYVPSEVSYRDYNDVAHTVELDLATDTTHVGERVAMLVRYDNALYVPATTDWYNEASGIGYTPNTATHYTWPWLGILLGAIIGVIAAVATACGLDGFVDNHDFSGRLGTR